MNGSRGCFIYERSVRKHKIVLHRFPTRKDIYFRWKHFCSFFGKGRTQDNFHACFICTMHFNKDYRVFPKRLKEDPVPSFILPSSIFKNHSEIIDFREAKIRSVGNEPAGISSDRHSECSILNIYQTSNGQNKTIYGDDHSEIIDFREAKIRSVGNEPAGISSDRHSECSILNIYQTSNGQNKTIYGDGYSETNSTTVQDSITRNTHGSCVNSKNDAKFYFT